MGIKRLKKAHGSICVQKAEFFLLGSEFRLEPNSFGKVKSSFNVSEKVMVFLVGLPVFDHSAVPPCNKNG